MLAKFDLNKAYTINTPMKETAIFEQRTEGEALPSKKECYQGIIRSIIFSMVDIRPDIAFATLIASCFAKNPSHQYTKVVKIILQYPKGSRNRGITYTDYIKLKMERYPDSY